MSENTDEVKSADKFPSIRKQIFEFGPWTLISAKSHILSSKCISPEICSIAKGNGDATLERLQECVFCKFGELSLPQLPDMTFAANSLTIKHKEGFGIEFNCLDALKLVESKQDLMKVAIAELWQQARSGCEHAKDVVKPFDWTFSTSYKGTILSSDGKLFKISETSERIDLEKLKIKEKIMFYDDIHLFEDELADNGSAQCSVKIRVMESSFFVLLRYFLRVDQLLIRIYDTRVYHEADKNYMLREHTNRESKLADLQVSTSLLNNPGELCNYLPVISSCYEKLEFPS